MIHFYYIIKIEILKLNTATYEYSIKKIKELNNKNEMLKQENCVLKMENDKKKSDLYLDWKNIDKIHDEILKKQTWFHDEINLKNK